MDQRDFVWLFAANLALYRAVFVEEAELDGVVIGVRLHCISSVIRTGDSYYVGGQKITNRMRLIRLSVWPTVDAASGSTLLLAREVFAGAMANNAYTSDFWQQGGAPITVISVDRPVVDEQTAALADRWVERRTTSPGKPAVIGNNAKLSAFGADLGTEGANVSADKLRSSIARYFKMPPGIVNVPSEAGSLTYSTTEQEGIHLVRYTIQPYCNVIGRALSRYLPGNMDTGERVIIDPSKLTWADQLTRFTAWESALRGGWLSAEEVRAKEGYAPGAPEPVQRVTANVGA
jgi:phage portal protein BeeE